MSIPNLTFLTLKMAVLTPSSHGKMTMKCSYLFYSLFLFQFKKAPNASDSRPCIYQKVASVSKSFAVINRCTRYLSIEKISPDIVPMFEKFNLENVEKRTGKIKAVVHKP